MTHSTDPIRENEALWDAWTDIHEASAFYDLEGFRQGGIRPREEEIAAVGDVSGKTLPTSSATLASTRCRGPEAPSLSRAFRPGP